MVEVILDMSIDELSNDLYSSINWSRVGLKTFKQFKNSVFKEFEERELRLSLKYEKVTPFANQDIEIEYINEVQYVGEEEEFNLESFDIFGNDDEVVEEQETSPSLEGLVVDPEVYESLSFDVTGDGFDYYGEDFDVESDEESDNSSSYNENFLQDTPEENVKVIEDKESDFTDLGISKELSSLVLDEKKDVFVPDNELEALLGVSDSPTNLPPKKDVVVKKKEVVYHNGMSLRQFLRENPRSTMDVAETYFSRKDIMKEIQLGRVIKRGQKLFI